MKSKETKNYLVDGKQIDILKEDWDILIVLDACRYDIFKTVYKEIFGSNYGILKKAISPATWTMEWLNKVFNDEHYDDIIYISGNPYINSKVDVSAQNEYDKRRCFNGKKHFYKIVDVWDWGWDSSIGNVHPMQINKAFHRTYLQYPNKRFILHYMQPHMPYVSLNKEKYQMTTKQLGGSPENISLAVYLAHRFFQKKTVVWMLKKLLHLPIGSKFEEKIYRVNDGGTLFFYLAHKFISEKTVWMLKKFFYLSIDSKIEEVYRIYGVEGLFHVCMQDVKLALNFIKMLTDSISTNWLIISDHGDRIGTFWHDGHGGRRDKEVINVPWFEIYGRNYHQNMRKTKIDGEIR